MSCTGYMVFLASFHVGGGVCASGKLALADISTRSMSGPFSAVRAVAPPPPPAGFCGSRGCENRALDFFQSLWDWTGITAAALPSCLSDFGAIRSIYTPDLAALGTRRWGFLPCSWQGPKIIYWNTLHVISLYYLRHYFVIGPSSLFCMDVYDHIINVFPVHSLNKRFLILIFWFWLETWDVAILYTGGTRTCVTVQWMSVDNMTLSPAKLNLIWTATVNSRVMTGESQTQSWSFTSVLCST